MVCELYLKSKVNGKKKKGIREKRKINYKGITILKASFLTAVTGAIKQRDNIFKILRKNHSQ